MMVNTSLVCVLFILACFFVTAHTEITIKIPKCHPSNRACIGKTVTKILHRRDEFPALQFPKLDPYTPAYPWLIRTLDTYLPVNFDGNWTNITIYGMDKAVFEHIKLPYHMTLYSGPIKSIESNNTIEAKVFVPNMEIHANVESDLRVLMWPMHEKGIFNFNLSGFTNHITVDCDVIQQNGKDYVNVKNVHSKFHLPQFSHHVKFENIGPFISHVVDGVLDSHWRHLIDSMSPDLEIHIGNIIKEIINPVVDVIPIKEFTYESSDLEVNPVGLTSGDSSSNSGGVVQKLASSILIWSLVLLSQMSQYFCII